MTPHSHSHPGSPGERGVALVAALLLMMVMSGLAIALAASGRIEVAMGDNEQYYEGARAAAEAGLNHAAAVVLGQIADPMTYQLNDILKGPDGLSDPSSPGAAVNNDNGQISHLMFPAGPAAPWPVSPGSAYSYDVRLFDDDNPELHNPVGTPFTNAELIAMGPPGDPPEDGTGLVDVNKRIVIRAIGYGPRGTVAVLEQMLQPIKMPALLVDTYNGAPNPTLELAGNAHITGGQGSVHTNGNLQVTGTSVVVDESATATGTLTSGGGWAPVNGMMSGGMPEIPVPDIQAINYIGEADFILRSNGTITYPGSTTNLCGATCANTIPPGYTVRFGWNYVNAGPNSYWRQLNDNVVSATYYAETNVQIGGTGSSMLAMSIIATGSIEVTGTPNLQPEPFSQLMFVTSKDLNITGDLTGSLLLEGLVLVREQIHFSGNTSLVGQVIVQNEPHTAGTPVAANVVEGNFTLTYNGIIETIAYAVSGWRETQ